MLRAIVFSVAFGAALTGAARAQFMIPGLTIQTGPTQAQQRAQVRPFIMAMTNCVAARVLEDDAGVLAFRDNGFSPYVTSVMDRCPGPLQQLTRVYEQVYGPGQADAFINGPYAEDLPRAVLKRIRPQLQAKLDTLRRDEAQQAARDAQAKEASAAREAQDRADAEAREMRAKAEAADRERQAEADRQRQAAEAEQQASIAKAEADRARAQERAAAETAEAERLKQLETEKGAAKLLAVKALDCGRDQLKSLVKSGEPAETLASAVMTICDADVDHFVDAGGKEYVLENQVREDDAAVGLARAKLRAETREHFVALAVQAKAGVGAFAPASSN